jgi:hypothetical protein
MYFFFTKRSENFHLTSSLRCPDFCNIFFYINANNRFGFGVGSWFRHRRPKFVRKNGKIFFIGSNYGVVKVNPGSFRLHVSVEPRSRSLKGEGCRLGVDE